MFNNKFNRLLPHPGYNVGGGIGEAALLGAAFGGAKSLVTGEDLLQGALLGGITGGAMSGASSLLSTAGEAAGTAAAEGLVDTAAQQAVDSSLNMVNPYAAEIGGANLTSALPQATQLTNQGITGLGGMQAIPQAAEQAVQTANAGLTGLNAPVGQGGLSVGNTGAVGNVSNAGIVSSGAPSSTMDFLSQPGVDLRQYTTPDTMAGKGLDWWADQGTAGRAMYSGLGGAVAGAMEPIPLPEEPEKQKSKLAGFDAQRFAPYMPTQPDPYYSAQYAQGGIAALAQGGMGNNLNFPQGRQDATQYATPTQLPASASVINADYEMATDPYSGSPLKMADGGIAGYSLGGYAAGGNPRLLKGPGDGMSDNIPATIGGKQPARLADGEFVVPADVVSHLGNGSTDAGAKHLYNMMDKVRKARTGSKKQGKQIKPAKFMPA